MITHYDLFAGIGGFSLALEEVFIDDPIRHIFCEWESFPTAVLRRHWPDGEFHGDIAELVAHTERTRLEGRGGEGQGHGGLGSREGSDETQDRLVQELYPTDTERKGRTGSIRQAEGRNRLRRGDGSNQEQDWTIVTGGFPCQPFSHAGRRKGTADDRYQWPNMFEVIRNTKPRWVVAENVRGLVTWNDGLVLETVCADLESEGYEVQPLVIPAVAVGAPHRRDRVWIIAHRNVVDGGGRTRPTEVHRADERAAGTDEDSSQRGTSQAGFRQEYELDGDGRRYPDWNRNWQEVAFATCDDTVDDGLSRLVDGVPYSRAKWRKDSLKAYGNGIVPEVAMKIMRAIKEAEEAERYAHVN